MPGVNEGRQVAQFLWVGPGLSALENLCLRSFVETGYEVHLYSYGGLERIPAGVILKDANEIIPENDQFFGPHTCGGRYANFADRFRYYLLYERGGWWFDIDHVALQLLPEPESLLVASQWEGFEHPTNSVIWCKPQDERLAWLKKRCDEIIGEPGAKPFIAMGPALIKEMVELFEVQPAPWWEFNPVPYYFIHRLIFRSNQEWLKDIGRGLVHRARQLYRPAFRAAYIRRGTRALHLSNEIWRANGYDKEALYHRRSIYGKIQRRLGFIS